MTLGCCAWNFMTEIPTPPEESIRQIAELGFDGFELIVFSEDELRKHYTPQKVKSLLSLYQNLGLELAEIVIDLGALWGLAQKDPKLKKDALNTFELGVNVARDLGCQIINFVPHWIPEVSAPHQFLPMYVHPVSPGVKQNAAPVWRLNMPKYINWQEAWDNYLVSLESCARIAEDRGLKIALEGHPLCILSTTDSFLRLFDQLTALNIGVNFDTSMLAAIHREYPPLSIQKLGNKIFNVHARDCDGLLNYGLPPGMGILPWDEIIRSLRQTGFDGFISIETGENYHNPTLYAKRSLEYLRNCIAS